jgi:hypothetical protein
MKITSLYISDIKISSIEQKIQSEIRTLMNHKSKNAIIGNCIGTIALQAQRFLEDSSLGLQIKLDSEKRKYLWALIKAGNSLIKADNLS